jgi:hypothetical protein
MSDRYARQRLIPSWDQDRLVKATAVVVGVGALGNEVAKNLALAGVGRLVVCDPDTVSVSNLSRSVLLTAEDVGRPKVEAVAASLGRLAPDISVEPRVGDLARQVGLGELADADAVLGCLDSRRAEAPLVDGGTSPWAGEVRLRLSVEDPCYGCSLSPRQRAEADLPLGCEDLDPSGPRPASIVSTAIVAGWMAMLALRVIFGERPATHFLRIEGPAGATAPVTVARDASCLHHRPLSAPAPTALSNRASVAELLSSLPPGAVPSIWTPFPVPAPCPGCGQRTGGVGPCPGCGRTTRPRYSEQLTDADGGQPLSSVGVAPEEILAVRMPKGDHQWLRLSR